MANYYDRDTKVAYVEQINAEKLTVTEAIFKRSGSVLCQGPEERYAMIEKEHSNPAILPFPLSAWARTLKKIY